MRLHLTVQRHGLPVSRILWTTSPPSLFGHNLPSPSSILPATSSAVTSSHMPNALYANGGYTIAQLLEDVNEVIPLETEPQLFSDESSGQWGLEDYAVEVGGSECLHFMEVEGLLRDGDEVLIRALQISDLRARRISGRHQISNDGKHLIDGIPFGKPFLKRPTSSRPAITIPPRKKRRTALAIWGSGSNYEEEDTEWAPPQHIGTGKELSLLRPESELGKEDEEQYEHAYQDDYEDYHEPNDDDDGTVIRHNIDKTSETTDTDNDASGSEVGDLSQELQDLKKDMEISALPELENPDARRAPPSHSLRSRPSILRTAPRKSSLSHRFTGGPSGGGSSRRESKSVTFDKQKQELPTAKPDISVPRTGSTSEEPEDSVSSENDSDSSMCDSSVSESSDEDSSSDKSASESESAAVSESSSDSSSDSETDSCSDVSESESESEQEEVPDVTTVRKPSHQASAPGAGSERTRKSNQRCKMRRRLTKLKQLGFLEENADFDALREWDSGNGDPNNANRRASVKQREHENFEAKRQKLLRELESGGVDVSFVPGKENISPNSAGPDTSELPEDQDEQYETANDTTQASPEVPKRRSLDVASTRRLLFGSLGVRTPRSKEEEEATRKKLAGKARERTSQQAEQAPAESHESEPEVDWREKLIIGATECVYDDIELTAPPFPFEQHWDSEAGHIIRQRKGRNRKRKRRQQLQVYDEEADGNGDYFGDDDVQFNYEDAEQPEAEANNKDESEETTKMAVDTEDDLPGLPSDASNLPDLAGDDLKTGLVFAFKQLDLSKATNWQPMVSEYRVATVSDVFDNNILNIQLARPYRRQAEDANAEEGPFKYSGFEMPGMDDEGEDDGFREVPFDDLIEPKLLRAAPAADAGDKDTASIFPADDEQAAPEPSQFAIDASPAGDEHNDDQLAEISNRRPTSLNDKHDTTPKPSPHEESPVRSPRFEGFELSHSASSPHSDNSPSAASSRDTRDEEQEGTSLKGDDDASFLLPSTCPPNADDHNLQESELTDQPQTISSPASVGSYHKLIDFFLSQNPSSPVSSIKSERKTSPVEPISESGSPTVPNPFYEIDKAYEKRRKSIRTMAQRKRSYNNSSSREPSPKAAKVDVPSSPRLPCRNSKSPESTQETSQVSVVLDSVRPEARDPSPPASQMPFFVDLTQSSPLVSPGGSDEDFAKTHRLPRGSGWGQKNNASTRRQTRQSSSSSRAIRTLEEVSISPPRRRRGRKS
ncbi:hypothetical protein BJX76DRAFT_219121 [Aspergillus varians]